MTDETEHDEQLEALTEAAMMWEGRLEAPADFPGTLTEALAPIVAAIRRQAAADALKEQARALGKTADFFRQQARAVEGKSMTSAEIYRTKADQCNLDANRLHREAQGIIAEGYEYTCEAGWDQCENRVPDAGDYCDRHEPEDDEDPRWAE